MQSDAPSHTLSPGHDIRLDASRFPIANIIALESVELRFGRIPIARQYQNQLRTVA